MTTEKEQTPAPTEQHKRAIAAVELMFRLFPQEAGQWVYDRTRMSSKTFRVLEASFIDQPPRGPTYVVPPPRAESAEPEVPKTPEALVKKVFTDVIARDAAASGVKVEVISFDMAEAVRQTMAKGGCDVELLMRAEAEGGEPYPTLFGVGLPGEHEDGMGMPWYALEKMAWHIQAFKTLVLKREPKAHPCLEIALFYLWPWTGLKDPQENCSVFKKDPELPGFLGGFFQERSEEGKKARREMNRERLEDHEKLDRERRAAAEKRREVFGDAGIKEEELAALVPEIDLDNDRYSLRITYPIVRIWEHTVKELLLELPLPCVGLSFFGYRPEGVTAEDVLAQCAWVLRKGLRDLDTVTAQRATAALVGFAVVFIDIDEVKRTLARMKLV